MHVLVLMSHPMACFLLYLQSAAREAAVMAEVGPGGLLASDFQLSQRLARLSVQQVRMSLAHDPAQLCVHQASHALRAATSS